MNKWMQNSIKFVVISAIGILISACDPGTVIQLSVNLDEPISDECIESALKALHLEYKDMDNDDLSYYSFSNGRNSINVWQSLQEDGTSLLTVGSVWLGEKWSEDRERQLEQDIKIIMAQIQTTCDSDFNEASEYECIYGSFYNKENKCPSERKAPMQE